MDVKRLLVPTDGSAHSLRALAPALQMLRRKGVKAEILVQVGEPGETIAKVARQKHCGEIVLGGRGVGESQGPCSACAGNRRTVGMAVSRSLT